MNTTTNKYSLITVVIELTNNSIAYSPKRVLTQAQRAKRCGRANNNQPLLLRVDATGSEA